MKQATYKAFYVFLASFFICSICSGQNKIDSISIQLQKTDSNVSANNKKLSALDTTIKKLDEKLKTGDRKDSTASGDTTMFNSWRYYKLHPELLYAKACATCDGRYLIIQIITCIFLLLFICIAFYYLKNSALCRDESYITDSDGHPMLRPYAERPYSYSRVQMFWWTIIILGCYGIFFVITGKLVPLNPTCVLLLGGGLVTQIFGKVIDNSQKEDDKKKDSNNDLPARHQDISTSKDLITDILSDDSGISMHRLQSVAFNIIFGIGFIGFFVTNLCCKKYPFIDYEEWQLTLLGISTMGYLGLKTKENGKDSEPERINVALNEKKKLDEKPDAVQPGQKG